MKISRVFLAVMCAGILTGCTDYSLPKVTPGDTKTILVSETDSKMLISQSVTSMLTTCTSLNSSIIVYTEDTVKPTTEMKTSLKEGITTAKDSIKKTTDELNAVHVSASMQERQKSVVDLANNMISTLDSMLKAIDKNDFTSLKELHTQFKNDTSRMQSYSIN